MRGGASCGVSKENQTSSVHIAYRRLQNDRPVAADDCAMVGQERMISKNDSSLHGSHTYVGDQLPGDWASSDNEEL